MMDRSPSLVLALVVFAFSGCKSTPADLSQAPPESEPEVVTKSKSESTDEPGGPRLPRKNLYFVGGTADGSVLVLRESVRAHEFSWFDVRTGKVVASAKTEEGVVLHFVLASADAQRLVLARPVGEEEDYRKHPRFAVEVIERRTGETRRVRELDGWTEGGVLHGSPGTLVMLGHVGCGVNLHLVGIDGSEPKSLVLDPDEPRSNSEEDCELGASRLVVGGPDWLGTLMERTELEIRDPRNGEVLRTLPGKRQRKQLQAIDAGRVVLAGSGGTIYAWDVTTGSELWTLRLDDLLPDNYGFQFAAVNAEQIAVLHTSDTELTAISRTKGRGASQAVSGSEAVLHGLPGAFVLETDAAIRVYDPSLALVASIVLDADGPVLER